MPKYLKTDHYDGSHFFNPKSAIKHGFWAGFKMLLTTQFEKWPAYVENAPAPNLSHTLNHDEVAVTFVNHATVLVQSKHFNFLTDPVWSERVSPVTWAGPKRHRAPGISFDALPRIDFVVISHNHYDHLDLSTLKRLEETFHPHFFVPFGNKTFLESQGLAHVIELDWWQTIEVTPELKVSLTPAQHFSGRSLFDKNKSLWGSYFITCDTHTFYFAGDTGYSSHFKDIFERFGPPDIAFLPIGAYEPRWFMKSVHINPEEAVQAHLDLGANQSIGIHFGTFQLTGESIDQPVKDLEISLTSKQVAQNKFITLNEGATQIFTLKK